MDPRESFCGVCEYCGLGSNEVRRLATRLLEVFDTFQLKWWLSCLGNSLNYQGLVVGLGLLADLECPGCKAGGCVDECPIRDCASERELEDCSLCDELERCEKFQFVSNEFPEVKKRLLGARLKHLASLYHSKLMSNK